MTVDTKKGIVGTIPKELPVDNSVIQLHPDQWRAYQFKRPYGFVLSGTKAGKTFLGSIWAQKKITEYPLGNGLIGAPTNKIMQQATLDTFFNLFPEYRSFYKKQESIIVLPSGGKVYIRSTDEPLAIEGFNLDWAWLDEIGMMSRLVWVIAKGKVAISRGQILGTTNAYYLNWLYKEVYIPAGFINGEDQTKVGGNLVKVGAKMVKRDKEIEIFNWKSIDNPYFPKEFADREKERMSAAEYARRYEGRFVRMEGLVWEIDESHILEDKEQEQYLKNPERVIGGVDWGFTNPAAILIIKIKDGKYYVVDEWKEARRTTNDIIQKISEFNRKHFVQTWYPDPAEPDRIEEMRRANLIVGDVNKDIPLGIGKVQSLFKKHKLFILDNCKELQDELEQYRYEIPKEMRDGKEVPLKVNDHCADCLRYSIMGNELSQNYTYQEERAERARIRENRMLKKEFELL